MTWSKRQRLYQEQASARLTTAYGNEVTLMGPDIRNADGNPDFLRAWMEADGWWVKIAELTLDLAIASINISPETEFMVGHVACYGLTGAVADVNAGTVIGMWAARDQQHFSHTYGLRHTSSQYASIQIPPGGMDVRVYGLGVLAQASAVSVSLNVQYELTKGRS